MKKGTKRSKQSSGSRFQSTKIFELGSCAFRQPFATSHCRFIHGYNLTAKVWFECDRLDDNNWVVDFGALGKLKDLFRERFDHTLCVAENDPKIDLFRQMHDQDLCVLRIMPNGVGIERFAEWCFHTAEDFVTVLTDHRCNVAKVEVWEHDKNSAMYIAPVTWNQQVINTVIERSDRVITEHQRVTLPDPIRTVTPTEKIATDPIITPVINQTAPIPAQVGPTPPVSVGVDPTAPRPAPVGNTVTSGGWGDPFKGTSWGAGR